MAKQYHEPSQDKVKKLSAALIGERIYMQPRNWIVKAVD